MSSVRHLAQRIRGEDNEMPGLRLTISQAARLWQVDAPVRRAVLDSPVDAGIRHCTSDGAYIARPPVQRYVPAARVPA